VSIPMPRIPFAIEFAEIRMRDLTRRYKPGK
jgi:hypothetical protein